MKIQAYKILCDVARHELEKDVNKQLKEGWVLLGQPFYVQNDRWYQCMIMTDGSHE